jgi:hypothetical protein
MSSMRTLAIDDFTAASITSWNHPAEKCGVCVREGMQHSYTTQYIHRYLCSFYYFPVPHLSATSCTLGSFTYLLCIVTSLSSSSVVWCKTNLQIGQGKKSYIQTGSRDTIRICLLNQQSRNLWSFTETINREMADLEVNVSLMNSRYVRSNLHVLHVWSWAQFLWVKCIKFLSRVVFVVPADFYTSIGHFAVPSTWLQRPNCEYPIQIIWAILAHQQIVVLSSCKELFLIWLT